MYDKQKKEPVIDEEFVNGLRDKIQKQIADIAKMDVVTAVATDEYIGGYIPPQVESIVNFIGAREGQEIRLKTTANNDNSSSDNNNTDSKLQQSREKQKEDLYATILVRTIIRLKGDIAMVLRSEPIDSGERQVVSIDQDILAAHQANVILAVENWHFFIRTALDALRIIFDLARPRE